MLAWDLAWTSVKSPVQWHQKVYFQLQFNRDKGICKNRNHRNLRCLNMVKGFIQWAWQQDLKTAIMLVWIGWICKTIAVQHFNFFLFHFSAVLCAGNSHVSCLVFDNLTKQLSSPRRIRKRQIRDKVLHWSRIFVLLYTRGSVFLRDKHRVVSLFWI